VLSPARGVDEVELELGFEVASLSLAARIAPAAAREEIREEVVETAELRALEALAPEARLAFATEARGEGLAGATGLLGIEAAWSETSPNSS